MNAKSTFTIILILFLNNIYAQTAITAGQNNENISFYDFLPDQTITCNNVEDCYLQIPIDINNDATADFKLISYYGFSDGEGLETNMIETLNNNEIVYQTLNTNKIVKIFNENDVIDSSLSFTNSDAYFKYKYVVGSTNINDEIASFQDKFLAVKIKKDDIYLFGWIKLSYENSKITVKESGVFKYNPNSIIELENEANVSVFPNPNNGSFSIKFENNIFDKISIFDNLGKVVYSESAENKKNIKVENLEKGFYFIKFSNEKTTFLKKVVVE